MCLRWQEPTGPVPYSAPGLGVEIGRCFVISYDSGGRARIRDALWVVLRQLLQFALFGMKIGMLGAEGIDLLGFGYSPSGGSWRWMIRKDRTTTND